MYIYIYIYIHTHTWTYTHIYSCISYNISIGVSSYKLLI